MEPRRQAQVEDRELVKMLGREREGEGAEGRVSEAMRTSSISSDFSIIDAHIHCITTHKSLELGHASVCCLITRSIKYGLSIK